MEYKVVDQRKRARWMNFLAYAIGQSSSLGLYPDGIIPVSFGYSGLREKYPTPIGPSF